jgi:hypothetical protein
VERAAVEIEGFKGEGGGFADAESASVDDLQDRAVAEAPGLGKIGEFENPLDLVLGERSLGRDLSERRRDSRTGEGLLEHEASPVEMARPERGRAQVRFDGGSSVMLDINTERTGLESPGVGFKVRGLEGLG